MQPPSPWSHDETRRIGQRVAMLRKKVGMSARALAERTSQLGSPMSRGTLAKLESGGREDLAVSELRVLAEALNVPASFLLFPVETGDDVEALPGTTVPAWTAFQRFTGEARTSGYTTRPQAEQRQLGDALFVLQRLRWQDEELDRWERADSSERRASRQLQSEEDEGKRARLRDQIDAAGRDRRAAEDFLARLRADMREREINPGDVLPDELVHLDEASEKDG